MAKVKQGGLGRGLNSLFADIDFHPEATSVKETDDTQQSKTTVSTKDHGENVVFIQLDEIKPNANQPRTIFDEDALQDLTNSVRTHGVIQPILLRPSERGYEIVAGERRYRAARKAGLKVIPAIIRSLDEKQNMLFALIENMQREDLNIIEEARGLKEMIDVYSLTQDQVATSVGKSRPYVSNALRLLKLPEEVQTLVMENKLTAGHARAIAGMDNQSLQIEAAEKAAKDGWSVRETEKYTGKKSVKPRSIKKSNPDVKRMEESLSVALGTKVKLPGAPNKGKIEIEYYSREELERLLELLLSVE